MTGVPGRGNTTARVIDMGRLTAGDRRDVREMLRMQLALPTWQGWSFEHTWWARQVAAYAIDGRRIPAAIRYGYWVTRRLSTLEIGMPLIRMFAAAAAEAVQS